MTDRQGAYTNRTQRRRGKRINQELLSSFAAVIPKESSVVDIGAGTGAYVQALRDLGYKATGIDGTPGIEKLSKGLVKHQNITRECLDWFGKCRWAIFIEVGEHIPAEFENMVIFNVSHIPLEGLIVSWADEGQRGRGHINCHNPIYIASQFGYRGWVVDRDLTRIAKQHSGKGYNKRLMVLRRKHQIPQRRGIV